MNKINQRLNKTRYYSPTLPGWRMVGDLCLVLIPVVHGIMASAPGLSDNTKFWVVSACDVILIAAKFLTNTNKAK